MGVLVKDAMKDMRELARRSLSPTSGIVTVAGLKDEVRIVRDKWGVPHIFAANMEDLLYAEGYVHAQDRLWQMEFTRRLAFGTLAEMLGEVVLDFDVFMRTTGLKRTAEAAANLIEEESDDLTMRQTLAYVHGVNEFIGGSINNPPFEFAVLGWSPSPWTLADECACSLLTCWQMGMNWCVEILRGALIERLGEERARELFPFFPTETSFVVVSQCQSGDIAAYLSALQKRLSRFTGSRLSQAACNNWVVDGNKSSTGKPLIAHDNHVPIGMPCWYYEVHLIAPGFNVIGATFPGLDGVLLGHNGRIAWNWTSIPADTMDTYIEKLNPDNPHQYLYKGKWEDAEVCVEQFHVRGKDQPVTKEMLTTRHGPIMDSIMVELTNPEIKRLPHEGIAVRWVGHDPSNLSLSGQALARLNQARNWEEFRAALRLYVLHTANYLYADIDGNIGYQATGLIPIRTKGQGLVPVPGWTGEYEWAGYIPFDELPSAFNPPAHFIATANNKMVPEDYPYHITHDWLAPYRARRIVQLLTVKDKYSLQDFKHMQGDVYSIWAEKLVPFLTRLTPIDRRQREALGYLRTWDLNMGRDSVAAAIFHVWYAKLANNILGEKLGHDLYEQYFCFSKHHFLAVPQLLEYHDSYWFGGSPESNLEKRDGVIRLSLTQALEELTKTLGKDISTWRWGRLHSAAFRHPLGIGPPMDQVLNAGPIEVCGDGTTVNPGSYEYRDRTASVMGIAAYRHLVDLDDLSKSVAMLTPGQSGQPGSKHYRDFVEPWSKVEYHPMLFNREDIEKEAEEVLMLLPTGPKKAALKNKKA